jgi:uncharacterized membrane protein YtjA (UPF0391 family)
VLSPGTPRSGAIGNRGPQPSRIVGHPRGTGVEKPRVRREITMFNWAIIFFIIALLAAVFGFGGIAGAAAGAAKITFVVALILAVASFITSRGRG